MQEAVIELARQRVLPDEPVAWLVRVVRNKALSLARAEQRRQKHEEQAARTRNEMAPGASFAGSLSSSMEATEVAAALAELEPDQREIVVAHLWNGLTFREIGAILGLTDSTAHRRYRSALEQLRIRLARQSSS